MNTVKKYSGIVWMTLAPIVMAWLVLQAVNKISMAPTSAKHNVMLQWIIILIVFAPILLGLLIFGFYALKGEYAHLPEDSSELEDDYGAKPL
jgi:hypothetical protein